MTIVARNAHLLYSQLMSEIEHLTFACQGNEYSYHGEAARQISGDPDAIIINYLKIGEVVQACRRDSPGLGVVAVSTAAGTVNKFTEQVIQYQPDTVPRVVGRTDVPVSLAIIGSEPQSIEELNHKGALCLVQDEARVQCRWFLKTNLNWVRLEPRAESTRAISEAVEKAQKNIVAIGPSFAAEALGGTIIGPRQINPPGSVTSFYALQRDHEEKILPKDPEKTESRAVISLTLHDEQGAFDKSLAIIDQLGLSVVRFIAYDRQRLSRRHDGISWYGGLLEVKGKPQDAVVWEFITQIVEQKTRYGREHQFMAHKLGRYDWYPEEPISLQTLLDQHSA